MARRNVSSTTRLLSVAAVALLAGCSKGTRRARADAGPAPGSVRGWGDVMSDVGRRFELAGRAATANRFELAAFEVNELRELFENELPRAQLPKEGPTARLPAMADAFAKTQPFELIDAAHAKDARAFARAYRRAAETCNACHEVSGRAYIQIPAVPGRTVPDLDPLPAP